MIINTFTYECCSRIRIILNNLLTLKSGFSFSEINLYSNGISEFDNPSVKTQFEIKGVKYEGIQFKLAGYEPTNGLFLTREEENEIKQFLKKDLTYEAWTR